MISVLKTSIAGFSGSFSRRRRKETKLRLFFAKDKRNTPNSIDSSLSDDNSVMAFRAGDWPMS